MCVCVCVFCFPWFRFPWLVVMMQCVCVERVCVRVNVARKRKTTSHCQKKPKWSAQDIYLDPFAWNLSCYCRRPCGTHVDVLLLCWSLTHSGSLLHYCYRWILPFQIFFNIGLYDYFKVSRFCTVRIRINKVLARMVGVSIQVDTALCV